VPTRRSVLASAVLVPLAGKARASAQDATEEPPTKELGIVYAEVAGEQLLLDVILPSARDATRPAVVLLHPWGGLRADLHPHARALAAAGYVGFVVDYRYHWPEYIDDGQLAVRWVRAHAADYGVDPERIGAYGQSAGAEIAATLGVRDTRLEAGAALAEHASRVVCVVDIGGSVDLTIPFPNALDQDDLTESLGGTFEEIPNAYRAASPISYVDAQSAPFLIVHGGRDLLVPIEHAQRMTQALQAAEVEVVYAYFPGGTHGTVGNWPVNGALALAFLGRHLHPEP
jgi:acetyl esterase/lipase